MPWHVINQYRNLSECWRVVKLFLNETLNMHALIRHKRVKGNSVPWITPEIKCIVRNRDYHKKYAIKHASQSLGIISTYPQQSEYSKCEIKIFL